MDSEWFEQRKRRLRRIAYINVALFCTFFLLYMIGRGSAIHVSVWRHTWTAKQHQDVLDAQWRASVCFWGCVVTAIVGLWSWARRMRLVDEYNRRILATDPMLQGDYIPVVK